MINRRINVINKYLSTLYETWPGWIGGMDSGYFKNKLIYGARFDR
jgi:hypothetical protein